MHPLISIIIEKLEDELKTAISASQEAHSSATHSENIATDRYDTLALEAAYLAHGQSLRISELHESILLYKNFKPLIFNKDSTIQPGALVCLESEKGELQNLFIGPAAGGLKFEANKKKIMLLTPSTPLGKVLLNKTLNDEVQLNIKQINHVFTVIDIQ